MEILNVDQLIEGSTPSSLRATAANKALTLVVALALDVSRLCSLMEYTCISNTHRRVLAIKGKGRTLHKNGTQSAKVYTKK